MPAFTGVRTVTPDLAALREMIDWQFFFLAWELKGKYPAILGQPAARELFDDANTLLDKIIAEGQLQARGGYGFWPAHAEGDDLLIQADGPGPVRLPMLRQQTAKPAGRPNRCLADYVAPAGDHLGGFAVAIHGAAELAARFEAERDDYQSIMVKALADRLAEAFAEHTHLRARRDWFEPDADPAIEDLHAERFRGIRPALGYPASPDHSGKRELFSLLDAGQVRHVADRVVCDEPGGQRQRADLRPPRVALLHRGPDRPGPGRRLRGPAGRPAGRGGALAAPQPRPTSRSNAVMQCSRG